MQTNLTQAIGLAMLCPSAINVPQMNWCLSRYERNIAKKLYMLPCRRQLLGPKIMERGALSGRRYVLMMGCRLGN
jgi:hypothetical protein